MVPPKKQIVPILRAALFATFAFAFCARGGKNEVITLEQAYDRTLASDQNIRIAQLEIRKANLLTWSALARLGPTILGSAGYNTAGQTSRVRAVDAGATTRTTVGTSTGNAGFSYSQTLLDFSVFPAWKLGKLTAESARLQFRYTIRQTLFGVAQAYYQVLKQQSIVEVDKQTVALAVQQLDVAQKRFDAGDVARTDVLRAQATLEDARRQEFQDQGTLDTNRDTLSNILNLGGKTDFTVVEPANEREVGEDFESILQRAYAQREDYKAAALAIEQDIQRRNEVRAQYFPTITVGASQSWTNISTNSGRTDRSAWDASVGVSVPFFTGGQREIDLANAGYQISETRLNFEKAGKALESEVKTAWLSVRTFRETLRALRAEVVAAEQNYHDLQTQYQAGTATSLDVQVGLRDLNNARTLLIGATYDYQVALRNLLRADAEFQASRVEKIPAK